MVQLVLREAAAPKHAGETFLTLNVEIRVSEFQKLVWTCRKALNEVEFHRKVGPVGAKAELRVFKIS